ncbi:MAG TPA: hypothetical protein VLM85_12885 [Polyangiaceae bacterium]|nr:hypothetical protein [Polyangiaceae bacterium]
MGDKSSHRRLTVLQSKPEDDEPPRPPWHWVGFGAVAIFVVWLPLAYGAESVSSRVVASRLPPGDAADLGARLRELSPAARRTTIVLMAMPHVAALVLAALAGGFLVTRFGAGTRPREAALAGLMVGLLALGLTYAQTGVSLAPLVVPLVATLAAWLGGRLGRRAGA